MSEKPTPPQMPQAGATHRSRPAYTPNPAVQAPRNVIIHESDHDLPNVIHGPAIRIPDDLFGE